MEINSMADNRQRACILGREFNEDRRTDQAERKRKRDLLEQSAGSGPGAQARKVRKIILLKCSKCCNDESEADPAKAAGSKWAKCPVSKCRRWFCGATECQDERTAHSTACAAAKSLKEGRLL
jgi:hypothetical protein